MVRTDGGIPLSRTSSAMAEGTVLMSVTSEAADSTGNARAFSARMILPPQVNGANNSNTERSKQMEVEASTHVRISFVKSQCANSRNVAALKYTIAVPIGFS